MSDPLPASTEGIDAEAARWLARRDRGLSPAEQDAYLQWLRADPRHAAAINRAAAVMASLIQLSDWQPALSAEPNPDLFAPRRTPWWRRALVLTPLAAAAALVVGLLLWPHYRPASPPRTATAHLRVNERQALPDGSIIELKDGTDFAIVYSEHERRIRLTGGEAHFTVAKNPLRPFIVEAHGVEVRAVGTVFNVRLDSHSVDVLVTEGKVHVKDTQAPPADTTSPARADDGLYLVSGQMTALALERTTPPAVASLSPAEVSRALEWQTPRLQFYETPLAEAVAEFNRHNQRRILISDTSLNDLPIGGTFRVDNAEGFVRLLELTLDLRSEPAADGSFVLRRAR